MPEQVGTFPGSWISTLPWEEMANGKPWIIDAEEMSEAGVKLESVRAAAHGYAKEAGIKFKTKVVDDSLYLIAVSNG